MCATPKAGVVVSSAPPPKWMGAGHARPGADGVVSWVLALCCSLTATGTVAPAPGTSALRSETSTQAGAGAAPSLDLVPANEGPMPEGPTDPFRDRSCAGIQAPIVETPEPPGPWITFAAGLVASSTGLAFGFSAAGAARELEHRLPALTQTEAHAFQDRARTGQVASAILIGTGVAAMFGALAWRLWWAADPAPEAPK